MYTGFTFILFVLIYCYGIQPDKTLIYLLTDVLWRLKDYL